MKKHDIIIIGGGIIGITIAYELSKYKKVDVLLLEKNPLLADETSKGNSGVIHCGFDADSNKIESKLNVLGNRLWQEKIFKDVHFPRAKVDSLVLAFNDLENEAVEKLYQRGLRNGVLKEHLKILTKEQILKKEPLVNNKVQSALLCTNSWSIDPQKASYALAKVALQNKVKIELNSEVETIEYQEDFFYLKVKNSQSYKSKIVINAAGHYGDEIAKKAGYGEFKLKARRGQYRILARSEGHVSKSILFMVPTIHGKGVIVSPMLDGRVLVGPTAEENIAKDQTRLVTSQGFDLIEKNGKKIIPSLKIQNTEMTFAGSRPIDIQTNDFVIKSAKDNPNFINVVGTKSPGLSAAPAIALEVVKLIKKTNLKITKKSYFKGRFKELI